MARSSIGKTEVEKARDSLIAQGQHPSVDAVRVALGNTGSKSTIHRYLKELEADAAAAPARRGAVISDALQHLIAQLTARIQEEADTRITEIQARCDAAVQRSAEALADQEREGRALSDRLQHTEAALQEATRAHRGALEQLQERRIEIKAWEERSAGLTARLTDQDAHRQSLEQKHSQARDALEHFRQSAKEQRDTESRRHEHQVQTLQVELRQAADLITTKNHEVTQFNRDNARLTELQDQSERELDSLQRKYERLSKVAAEVPKLKQENQTLDQQRVEASQECDRLRAEVDRYAADLAAERQARLAEAGEESRRETRLQSIEELLAQLKEKSMETAGSTNTDNDAI
ncbi:DNA-binding protein [Salinisphaera sp. P385]|uniref:DNA-binding protein n=1 Tax=Spectribacter acetivorans TaxID=3075603 RepID=A0ABU3B9X1_9GAMM|nr:DNA-binding protein [Salinisphaera sp. P385]MDT0618617.1 DNA-binding protein [Salinisphaera sp. P385]